MISINDRRVRDIPIVDSREPFIDLRGVNDSIKVDTSLSQITSRSPYFCSCRKTVADLLVKATESLPDNLFLYIKEAYRPPHIQRLSLLRVTEHYVELFPDMDEETLLEKGYEYVAPLDVAPHPAGAAIDLTLIDSDGIEQDMGTEFDAMPADVEERTFTDSPLISDIQRRNRSLLIEAMTTAGMVNYPSEWWHWSYGDKYWAFNKGGTALYGPVEESDLQGKEYTG